MKSDKIDSRFIYNDPPKWKQGQKQFLWGSEYVTIPPTTRSPTLFEFELPVGSTLLFGNLTGFYVKGSFEVKEADTADTTFATVAASAGADVALIPNWFEHLLKDPQIYHGNMPLNPHDVPRYSDAFLNSYLYAYMYKETKKCLFPEPSSPGHCIGHVADDFKLTEDTTKWRKYASNVFGSRKVSFRYVPMHMFPFMQQTNFCTDGRPPAALPLPVLQKITIQLPFKENQAGIFMKPSTNTKEYRFKIDSIVLVAEEARINPTMERSFLNQKGLLHFAGLTKFAMTENVSSGVQQHRLRFQDVPQPEGLFIFALPKTALSGEYKTTEVTAKIFKNHNIQNIDVQFNNMPLAIKSPNFGNVRRNIIELKQLMDHYEYPPFGVLQDPEFISLENVKNGAEDTAFPHVYIPFCPSGKETRIVPIGADGQVVNKNGDLDITLDFGTTGAADATYLAYIFYTDVNLILDMNSKTFFPMYKKSKAN